MSEYTCENHKLNLACLGCIMAHIKKKEKLLEFVKEISNHFNLNESEHELKAFSGDNWSRIVKIEIEVE